MASPTSLGTADLRRFLVMSSTLKKLKICKMEKLKEIWPSELSNNGEVIISQLREIEVSRCDSLVNLFPSNPMSLLHHLEQLTVMECRSIDVLFNIDLGSSSSSSSYVGEIEEDSSSNLRSIYARECWKLREVWRVKGVNNSNYHLPILAFQSVESLWIIGCKRLRNVFTPTTSNFDMRSLKKITIDKYTVDREENKSINEEINQDISEVDVAFPSYLIHTFHQLHTLDLRYFEEAEVVFKIDSSSCRKLATTLNNQQLPHNNCNQFLVSQQEPKSSSFLNLTTISLYGCHRIKYLFSSLMAKLLSNLIKIQIESCDAMEEVVSNIDEEMDAFISLSSHTNTTFSFFPHLDILHLSGLKSLKRIDGVGNNCGAKKLTSTITASSKCYQVGVELKVREIFESDEEVVNNIGEGSTSDTIPRPIINMTNLPNLKTLHIWLCNSLKYIFTSCVLESLKKLQELKIEKCSAIQVIVKKEDDGGLEDVVFPSLTSLTLAALPNLKGFFSGKNEFRWPVLDEVKMYGCPQMKFFTRGRSMTPKLKYMNTRLGKHSLECGLNFDWTNENQLYNSSAYSIDADIIELLQFPWSFSNLIELHLGLGDKFQWKKTIFGSNELDNVGDIEEADDKVFEDETQSANNDHLSNKKQLVKSMDHPPTSSSSSLYIWKWKIKYSSNLSNLTKVSLDDCVNLEHVFSYGMAATLVQLQDLHITYCNKLKVIVEAVKEDSANKVKLVSFPCLKSLQLTDLRSLKGFCLGSHDEANFEWPSLHTLKIIKCPEITVFTNGQSTTPKLKVIQASFGLCEVNEDLNSFIRTKLQEGYKF